MTVRCPSVRPSISIDICCRRQSAAASGQRHNVIRGMRFHAVFCDIAVLNELFLTYSHLLTLPILMKTTNAD